MNFGVPEHFRRPFTSFLCSVRRFFWICQGHSVRVPQEWTGIHRYKSNLPCLWSRLQFFLYTASINKSPTPHSFLKYNLLTKTASKTVHNNTIHFTFDPFATSIVQKLFSPVRCAVHAHSRPSALSFICIRSPLPCLHIESPTEQKRVFRTCHDVVLASEKAVRRCSLCRYTQQNTTV